MKSTLSAIASKALSPKTQLLTIATAATFISIASATPSAEAKLVERTATTNKAGESVTVEVHTMYDMFNRPILTYSSQTGISGVDCSVPAHLAGSHEEQFYSNLFLPACAEHDYGYGHAPWQKAGFAGETGKIIADDRFMVDMLQICKAEFASPSEVHRKAACDVAAITYAEAVKVVPFSDWQRRQNEYTNDAGVQVMATMPVDPRTAQKRAEIERLRRAILDTRSTILKEREVHLADIQAARAVFERAQNEVAKIQSDITKAKNRIAQLNREIKAKEAWFHSLTRWGKIGGAAELAAYATPRRTEQGSLYTAIATLETARLTATAALEVPKQTLNGLESAFQAAHGAPVEADPRLMSLMTQYLAVLAI